MSKTIIKSTSYIPHIFDRRKIQINRDKRDTSRINPLFDWCMQSLIDRLLLVKKSFEHIIEIGVLSNTSSQVLCHHLRKNLKGYIQCDQSREVLQKNNNSNVSSKILKVQGDEEFLPFAPERSDLVLGGLTWHFINDLPGFLKQCYHILEPDGFLLGCMFGEETLHELSDVMYTVYAKNKKGITPIVAPFISAQQAGDLLQRTGFKLPVIDRQRIQIHYDNLKDILVDIKAFGGQASLLQSEFCLTKGFIKDCESLYFDKYSTLDNKLCVTLDFLFLSGWKDHCTQQKPLKPQFTENRLISVLES